MILIDNVIRLSTRPLPLIKHFPSYMAFGKSDVDVAVGDRYMYICIIAHVPVVEVREQRV